MKAFIIAILVSLGLSSCATLESVSLTQIPAKRKDVVSVESSRVIVFFMNFDNDFVDDLNEKLRRKCEGGEIKGILTKDEAVNYFLWLVYRRRVTARGFCVKS